ncbi:copper amine oxidase N-terminal domain-containing protein [Paenibacillus roseipurpureus]|uniref:Copper amine oxidase N-terminal domain-containing protein n=1 Tax=Paenibacillus roseopurpureus TaxID=2918901 RepID=A0AA96LNP5_9BACL|nr:copper amine oxidase N-terminal domain-containing protein [Paenibacillus sp. MBLB1832]WNR44408.1 copper amine oxidase N-terminal domain-containing protein [Paenibacillus sp. MBLB1832]
MIRNFFIMVILIASIFNLFTPTGYALESNFLFEKSIMDHSKYTISAITKANGVYVIVGEQGIIRTSQDGKNWTDRNSGVKSLLSDVTYGDKGFVAVGNSGKIVHSVDGKEWRESTLDVGYYFCAVAWNGKLYAAVGQSGAYISDDGIEWVKVYPDSFDDPLIDISSNGSEFIGISMKGRVIFSKDGETWYENKVFNGRLNSVIWDSKEYVAVGSGIIMTSPDGTKWTMDAGLSPFDIRKIAFDGKKYVAFSSSKGIFISTDMQNWINSNDFIWNVKDVIVEDGYFIAVGDSGNIAFWNNRMIYDTKHLTLDYAASSTLAWNGNLYMAVRGEGNKGSIWISKNGEYWEKVFSYPLQLHGAIWDGNQFVVVGAKSILVSQDGTTWKEVVKGNKAWFYAVEWNGSKHVAVGYDGSIAISNDGVKWNDVDFTEGHALTDVIWNGKQFLAIGSDIITSPDGLKWTKHHINLEHLLNRVIWNGLIYVAVGNNGLIYTSTDGDTWTKRESNTSKFIDSIVWDGKRFIALGSNLALVSKDGIVWSEVDFPYNQHIYDIHWNGYRFVGAASNDVGMTSVPNDIIKVIVNGKPLVFDWAPTILNDKTFVPIRKIFEALGAEVKWNEATNTVTATKGDKVIHFQVDNQEAMINGEHIVLDNPPTLINGSTFVPVRFVSESLGAKVEWDNETNTAVITLIEK